jgi:hypothetical protein
VPITLSGTAAPGGDYKPQLGSVTIEAGDVAAVYEVTPEPDDDQEEGAETILAATAAGSATVFVADNTAAADILVQAAGADSLPENQEAGQNAAGWYIAVNWDDDDKDGWSGDGWNPARPRAQLSLRIPS